MERPSTPSDAPQAPPQPPLTSLRLRLELDVDPTQPPIRFWYQPTKCVPNMVEFAALLANDISILQPHLPKLLLSMDGFALLPSAPTTLLRDGDAIHVGNGTSRLRLKQAPALGSVPVDGMQVQSAVVGGEPSQLDAVATGARSAMQATVDDSGVKRDAEGLMSLASKRRRARPSARGEDESHSQGGDEGASNGGAASPIAANGLPRAPYDAAELDWSAQMMRAQAPQAYMPQPVSEQPRVHAQPHASGFMPAMAAVVEAATLAQAQQAAEGMGEDQMGDGGLHSAIQMLLPDGTRGPYESPKDLDGSTRTALRKIAVMCEWKFRNLPSELQALVADDKLKISKGCLMEYLKNSRPKAKK